MIHSTENAADLRIALLAEEPKEQEQLIHLLRQCLQNLGVDQAHFSLFPFSKMKHLDTSFGKGLYHIVFLELGKDHRDTVSFAQHVRRVDDLCRIVLFSSMPDYVEESYRLRATHYLIKPLDLPKVMEALEFCHLGNLTEHPLLCVRTGNHAVSVSPDKVLYIDHSNHKTHIHLSCDRVIDTDESFLEIASILNCDNRFLQCFRCVMVNMDYVSEITGHDFVMKNGDHVPIVVRGNKSIREAFADYQDHKLV